MLSYGINTKRKPSRGFQTTILGTLLRHNDHYLLSETFEIINVYYTLYFILVALGIEPERFRHLKQYATIVLIFNTNHQKCVKTLLVVCSILFQIGRVVSFVWYLDTKNLTHGLELITKHLPSKSLKSRKNLF